MTQKEIQELRRIMKELSKIADIIEIIATKIFAVHMTIWREIMDREDKKKR